jgi:hypothetical protein
VQVDGAQFRGNTSAALENVDDFKFKITTQYNTMSCDFKKPTLIGNNVKCFESVYKAILFCKCCFVQKKLI